MCKKNREPGIGPPLWAWGITWGIMGAANVLNLILLVMRYLR